MDRIAELSLRIRAGSRESMSGSRSADSRDSDLPARMNLPATPRED